MGGCADEAGAKLNPIPKSTVLPSHLPPAETYLLVHVDDRDIAKSLPG